MLNDGFNEISYDFLWDLMGCFILDKVMFAHPSTTGFIKNGHDENIFAHP